MLAPGVTSLLPGGRRQPPYLFEDFQQSDATGIGTIDDTLGVLEAEAHHSWVNDCGGDAAGTEVRELSALLLQSPGKAKARSGPSTSNLRDGLTEKICQPIAP